MSRANFLKKLMRYLLLMLIAAIVLALGNKVVSASDCSTCPVNGQCKGKAYCTK